MDTNIANNTPSSPTATQAPSSPASEHLSYKFQRLRERIRQAVRSGELSGKLPGERELARRFNANPKTLSKALTDLAAEGLLERSIGRGTYVKGSETPAPATNGKWLILCPSGQTQSPLVAQLLRLHPEAEVAANDITVRPSFINQFSAVIDLAADTPEAFHRDLIVRGMPSLLLGREGGACRMHAVVLDRTHAAACLARDIFLAGHRRLLVIESESDNTVSHAARITASRYMPYASVESCSIDNVAAITDRANTAILCNGEACVERIRQMAQEHPHLNEISLAAIGTYDGQAPCTGIFTTASDLALAAHNLLRDAVSHRPTVLWLSGAYIDRGTIHAVPENRLGPIAPTQPTALSA